MAQSGYPVGCPALCLALAEVGRSFRPAGAVQAGPRLVFRAAPEVGRGPGSGPTGTDTPAGGGAGGHGIRVMGTSSGQPQRSPHRQ
ncbi:hypothetical protein [Plantactinospora sp. DSM 117369]